MIWQDLVITVVNVVFSLSLLPQIIHGFQEKKGLIKLATSPPTFIGLYVMSFTFLTLSLYFSAAISCVTGTMWLILFIQRLVYKS